VREAVPRVAVGFRRVGQGKDQVSQISALEYRLAFDFSRLHFGEVHVCWADTLDEYLINMLKLNSARRSLSILAAANDRLRAGQLALFKGIWEFSEDSRDHPASSSDAKLTIRAAQMTQVQRK
jgi:hypothetical protein